MTLQWSPDSVEPASRYDGFRFAAAYPNAHNAEMFFDLRTVEAFIVEGEESDMLAAIGLMRTALINAGWQVGVTTIPNREVELLDL